MPTVEFSPSLLDRIAYPGGSGGICNDPLNSGGNSPNDGAFTCASSRIILFSGTIPAQPRLMTSATMANALVQWTLNSSGYTSLSRLSTIAVTTVYTAAIATGTATWFSWCNYNGATPPATNGTLSNRIIGTVGTIGSGADLEMVTTSIVSGSQYRVYNLRMTLPSTYTY